jgi:hypothetical protein
VSRERSAEFPSVKSGFIQTDPLPENRIADRNLSLGRDDRIEVSYQSPLLDSFCFGPMRAKWVLAAWHHEFQRAAVGDGKLGLAWPRDRADAGGVARRIERPQKAPDGANHLIGMVQVNLLTLLRGLDNRHDIVCHTKQGGSGVLGKTGRMQKFGKHQ